MNLIKRIVPILLICLLLISFGCSDSNKEEINIKGKTAKDFISKNATGFFVVDIKSVNESGLFDELLR